MSTDSSAFSGGRSLLTGVVRLFLTSHLSVIFLAAALLAGVASVLSTPREEDPQIVVPVADVFVTFPGGSAEEVEHLVARPLEKLLWQIDGVEYVYSMSSRGMAVVTVRFYVGEDRERSLVKLHNRVSMHLDSVPPGVTGWVIKPIEIDDVPVVTVALHSSELGGHELRRIGEEVLARLEGLDDLSRTAVVGGYPRTITVEPDPVKLSGHGTSLLQLAGALQVADASLDAGAFSRNDRVFEVSAGPFIESVEDLRRVVVGVHGGRPVAVGDVAAVRDGGAEPAHYTRIGFGLARTAKPEIATEALDASHEAVTLAIAKKKGTNAVSVTRQVIERINQLKGVVIPDSVGVLVTRDYGETANGKVNDLLVSLAFAMASVVALVAVFMGWREGLVVAAAVPVSFSLSLFVNWLAGYTINRVTLFALILSLGLVVDDPITNVDNIQRHLRMGGRKALDATLAAVGEVLPPVIMSTLAIIVSFAPMSFITGMMGPYMTPMAINVPLTVTFSTVCALTFVPWLAFQLLKGRYAGAGGAEEGDGSAGGDPTPDWIRRLYRRVVGPLLKSRGRAVAVLAVMVLLLGGSGTLILFRLVPLKMLPFDNKNELQLVLDMPEGTTLERTDAVVRRFEEFLRTVPEVTDFESFVGVPSPMDFNGMVRHYYLRRGPHTADIRVNLIDRSERDDQSHTIALRTRKALTDLAQAAGTNLKIVEVPPGPPVLATIVAEVYSKPGAAYDDLIAAGQELQKRMSRQPGVVDLDDTTESPRTRLQFVLDKEKAALNGVNTDSVVKALNMALTGQVVGLLHVPAERQPLAIEVRLSEPDRSGRERLLRLEVAGAAGRPVPLSELGKFVELAEDQPIFHKSLRRVVFVQAEMAGHPPGTAVLDLQAGLKRNPLPQPVEIEWAGEGEWRITLRVFRDLGIAFGVALVGIYILVVLETSSFFMPLIIMSAIPLTAIGIMPGFWLMNEFVAKDVGGYRDSVFFTATGMIGMIALGGIVVRNSIVLIEFIRDRIAEGGDMRGAILESGAVRFRPIMLTAGTTAVGAIPITFDPIFSGLAWSLIFGLLASTVFSLVVVPVIYNMVYGDAHAGVPSE